jgi:hypothetical protein
METDGSW